MHPMGRSKGTDPWLHCFNRSPIFWKPEGRILTGLRPIGAGRTPSSASTKTWARSPSVEPYGNFPASAATLPPRSKNSSRPERSKSLKRLKTPLPPEIAAWTRLPGLSETVVQHLYFKLGIHTMSDLELLVRSHLLRTLPGVAASDEELLAAIDAMKSTP